MINLVAITFLSPSSTLVSSFQSHTMKTCFVLIIWDKLSFPTIKSSIICWRINSGISQYIRYIAEQIQVDTCTSCAAVILLRADIPDQFTSKNVREKQWRLPNIFGFFHPYMTRLENW